jgi:hypothetical protein
MRALNAVATCLLGMSLAASPAAPVSAEVYKWTDENGELHFTSDLSKVPPAHRERASAPRVDEKSNLNLAPPGDPDQQQLRDQRMRSLRRRNATRPSPAAKPRGAAESPASASPAETAPRKYDRNCEHRNRDNRCHSQLNPDWVNWNAQRRAGEAAAED